MERKQVEIIKHRIGKKKIKPHYKVEVECDVNDGDIMRDSFECEELPELDILMIAYLSYRYGEWPTEWGEAPEASGGNYIGENDRFNREGERGSWLKDWAYEEGYLLYAGMCDCMCHSVTNIEVTYFDEQGRKYECEFPDLGKLFASEEEFINYFRELDKELYG